MSVSILHRQICLEPKYLDQHLIQHLLETIKTSYIGTCTRQDGYIIDILRLVEITNNTISNANSEIIFSVRFEAKLLKPQIGDQFKEQILMVSEDGIFVEINKDLAVLIPASRLSEYTFDEETDSFVSSSNTLSEGKEVEIELEGIEYSNNTFSCWAKLAHK